MLQWSPSKGEIECMGRGSVVSPPNKEGETDHMGAGGWVANR